jgi:3-phytase
MTNRILTSLLTAAVLSCGSNDGTLTDQTAPSPIQPQVITEQVLHDTDDPAIWINPADPSQSIILGTDKGGDTEEGGLYVFRLDGTIDRERSVFPLNRPNNVDIAYGLQLGAARVDIAVVTVRRENKIRVFSLPDMVAIDNGGISVFDGDSLRDPMGVSLYTNLATNQIYAIVGRKSGPTDGSYLWQYELVDNGDGTVNGNVVRTFGYYSGKKEIEAIAVDNELGFVYYSDEQYGVRKYYAHPDSSNVELALFATTGVVDDHEGLSIYKNEDGTGYLMLSDQQGQRFHIYTREGSGGNPHDHTLLKVVDVAAMESDGSDVTHRNLGPSFPNGLFVAMSTDKTFHFYRWEDFFGSVK